MITFLACVLNPLVNLETENRINGTKDRLFGKLFFLFSWSGIKPFALSLSPHSFSFAKPRGDVTTTSCLGYWAPSP